MDPKRRLAYVSGVADSSHADEDRPGLAGRDGDVVHVFSYDGSGHAKETGTIAVPPPPGSPLPQSVVALPGLAGPPQSFPPPTRSAWHGPTGWPRRRTGTGCWCP